MEEMFDKKEARSFILGEFRKQGDFDFVGAELFGKMLDALMELDGKYLEKVEERDGYYDDEEAYAFLHGEMTERFPEYKMYMMRLVEDYLDYNEDYLNSIGAIDWE